MTNSASGETPRFETSAYSRLLGKGEIPTELVRFNWAAYFFPLLWAIVFRVWWVIGIFLLALLCGGFVKALSGTIGFVIRLLYNLMFALFCLWLGVFGHPLAWRASMRRQRKGNSEWRTVGGVLKGQRKWILFGVGFTVIGFFFDYIIMTRTEYGASIESYDYISTVISLAQLAAAVHLSRSQQWLWRALAGLKTPGL